MKISTTLRKARSYVSNGWTRGDHERRNYGKTCYCAVGAIFAVSGSSYDACDVLEKTIGTDNLADWNDRQKSKKSVLEAFDRAVAVAELCER